MTKLKTKSKCDIMERISNEDSETDNKNMNDMNPQNQAETVHRRISKKKHKHFLADSHETDEPKPKKSKSRRNPPGDESDTTETVKDLTPEEKAAKRKKSEKMKKKKEAKKKQKAEQKRQIEASLTPGNTSTAQKEALDYVKLWCDDRQAWKFNKVRQVWLLQHMYDATKVSDEDFSRILKYVEGLMGKSRDTTKQKAEALIVNLDNTDTSDSGSEVESKLARARQILQIL